jgi:integrase
MTTSVQHIAEKLRDQNRRGPYIWQVVTDGSTFLRLTTDWQPNPDYSPDDELTEFDTPQNDERDGVITKLQAENADLRAIVVSRRAAVLPGELSPTKIAGLIKKARDGKLKRWHGDGGNLWLQITNKGAAVSWVFRWTDRNEGRDRYIGLGSYRDVGLDLAREKAREYRTMLSQGKDPAEQREKKKIEDQIARGLAKTVSQVLDQFDETMNKHADRSRSHTILTARLFKIIRNKIGNWPIEKVVQNTILEDCGLRELWVSKHVTAQKLQNLLDRVFKFAIGKDYYHGKNPAAWETLKHLLPASHDVHVEQHLEGVPYAEMGLFMEKNRASVDKRFDIRTAVSFALELVALTGARGIEVRKARWSHIDHNRMVWIIPWQNLKSGKKHRRDLERPITKAMLIVLDQMEQRRTDRSPDALIFPPAFAGRTGLMSQDSFRNHMKQFNDWKTDPHGFRSTLKDWWRHNGFPMDWYEIQVDHALGNDTQQAYGSDAMLEERRGKLELWGDYCSKPAPPKPQTDAVIKLADKRRG